MFFCAHPKLRSAEPPRDIAADDRDTVVVGEIGGVAVPAPCVLRERVCA